MPTIYEEKGYRFFFYSEDRNEPAHDVENGEKDGKIWFKPQVKIKYLNDFKLKEQKVIMGMVEENVELLKTKWYEFFQQ